MCIQADTTSVFSKYFDTSILRNKIYFDTVYLASNWQYSSFGLLF